MRVAFKRIVGKVAEICEKLVLQITVSIAATVCVAAITNTFLSNRTDEGAAAPKELSHAGPHLVANLLDANFVADGFRSRVASVDEFAAVFGPNEDLSFSPPIAREWSVEMAELKADTPSQPKPRQVVATACADECSRLPVTGMLPPVRPAVDQAVEIAQVSVPSTEVSETRSLQLLGVSLPNLVPSPGRILKTVTSWGGSVADLVLR
jgi:hypothetical protein